MLTIPASLRTTARALRRTPGFFLIAVFTLAVGIGANAAIFTVLNAVLLRPLPYPEPQGIMGVAHRAPGVNAPDRFELSDGTYFVFRRDNRTLEDIGIYWDDSVTLTGGQEPERVRASGATASVFSVLRVRPARGRTVQADDEKPGADPIVVLSDPLWRRRFGGNPAAVGAVLQVDGVARRIAGVMPPGFHFPDARTELWEPMTIDPAKLQTGNFSYHSVARIEPKATPEQATRELSTLVWRAADLPGSPLTRQMIETSKLSASVRPLRDDIVGDVEQTLWVLLGSVGIILIIACLNVANLFLVRAEGRQREVAVRSALGATPGEIVRLFLGESLALSLIGGALGLALAAAGVRVLVALRPEGIPRLDEIEVDGTVLAFTVALALLSGLLVGLFAAARYGRPNLVPALKEGGRGGTVGRERLHARNLLVILQVAFALILLVGAGLMVKSFWRLRHVEPGLDPRGVLTLRLDLPEAKYTTMQARSQFVVQLLEKVRALPGVRSAGTISQLPIGGSGNNSGHVIEDFPIAEGAMPPILASRSVSPGYFETMRIPVQEGRTFDRLDPAQEGTEVVVSRAMAERFWPGKSPLGKRLTPGATDAQKHPLWYTIIGVVGNVRDESLDRPPVEAVYYPLQKRGDGGSAPSTFFLMVRGTVEPRKLVSPVRDAIWSLDPNLPLSEVRSMEEVVARSMVRLTFTMLLLVIAAAVALLLGAVGIYGVISYVVSQRTREIGVRMALGAGRQDISRLVLRQGFVLAAAGIVLGLVLAFLVTRLMVALLFEVSPTDPPIFASVPALLAAIALLACYIPARRAAAVQPLEAIRTE
ncbi:MAG TPA: ABC transporter permease [Thermoanaerobaculia bacterium]|nr:ABC transporter permease [Thermoanaerobaculia bacterium]